MIAVCIKDYLTFWKSAPEFKKGMQFDVDDLYIYSTDTYDDILDSVVSRVKSEDSYLYHFKDNIVYLPKTHFMLIEEWREQQINKIINEKNTN